MRKILAALGLSAVFVFVLSGTALTQTTTDSDNCAGGVSISPSDNDLAETINALPKDVGQSICLAPGTYAPAEIINLRDGDSLGCDEAGAVIDKVGVSYGIGQKCIILGRNDRVISASGTVNISWVDVSGATSRYEPSKESDGTGCPQPNLPRSATECPVAGSGAAIAMGTASPDSTVEYVKIHDNAAQGIGNFTGILKYSRFASNTTNPDYIGFTGAAVKGTSEAKIFSNYVRGEQGMGLWCDAGCKDLGPYTSGEAGWHVYGNLVLGAGGNGIRYEHSPASKGTGQYFNQPTALIENNRVAGSGNAGVGVVDAQNATVSSNAFGALSAGNLSYPRNAKAVAGIDSGRAERTDLYNLKITSNTLGGEALVGCKLSVVSCAFNAP